MIDRESVFSKPEIIKLLQDKFVNVALDQWFERRQDDNLGDFYRKIAKQGPRDLDQTTQGMYIADASGKMLGYINQHDPVRVQKFIEESLAKFEPVKTAPLARNENPDARFHRKLPDGGLVVRVNTKILGGYEETTDPYRKIFQESIARDNLWLTAEEGIELAKSKFPAAVAKRIARFNLVDNTRGEPPMWNEDEIKSLKMDVDGDGVITGKFELETKDGKRGFVGSVYGQMESEGEKLTRLDFVAKGKYWGEGSYTKRAPKGKFPIAMAFRLGDGSQPADKITPQGTKGWWYEYWK